MQDDLETARSRLASLSADRAELLQRLLEDQSRQSQQIRRRSATERAGQGLLPVSATQEGLWFLDQMGQASEAYHVPIVLRLQGPLDSGALEWALQRLVDRHEALRSVFVSVEGSPRQSVLPIGSLTLTTLELRGSPQAKQDIEIVRHTREAIRQRFDLANGPLIRARLLRAHAQEHVLIVVMHHIVCDGWSTEVLLKDLVSLYRSYGAAGAAALEELPLQYADFAHWQQQWLTGTPAAQQLAYWRNRLHAAPPLQLPTDRVRPAVQSHRGASLPVMVDAALSGALRAFAIQQGLTLFMLLYAAWAILLSRLSGQEDISVGAPVAGRQRSELHPLVGLFVNTLVLRAHVQGELTLDAFLQQVKELTLGAYTHQDLPFEKVVEALQPQRTLSHHPLFQVAFAWQSTPRQGLELPGLTVRREPARDEPAMFDLLLTLAEEGREITGALNFATTLFNPATVERWIDSYLTLLREITGDTQRRLCDLRLLPDALPPPREPASGALRAPAPDRQIQQLFERQVARVPDAVAVTHRTAALTYTQLNRKANQLARCLRARGVRADQRVAICLERGLEMVIGILGTLKSGGAYVPLDPSSPPDRLALILADAAPTLILTQESLRARLPQRAAPVISLDTGWKAMAHEAAGNLDPLALEPRAHHLAYVIYTSGSTGTPKGALIEHRNVTRLFSATLP